MFNYNLKLFSYSKLFDHLIALEKKSKLPSRILFTGQKGGDLFWVDSWQLSGLQKTTNILSSSYANSWIAPLYYENGNYIYDESVGNLNSVNHPGAMIETGSRAISSDRNIFDGSFVRLKNINVGYNFELGLHLS